MKKNIGEANIPEGFEEVIGAAPFANRNGPYYEKKIDDEVSIRAFRAAEKHLNGVKLVHGGMLMSFADSALARGVIRATGRRCVTIKMNSEFLSPARAGDWIEAHVEVIKSTKTVVFVRGELKVGRRTIFKADAIFHYVHVGRD
ncbi:MAG: PaaI family thioesterase [Sneathiella sp.]|uniref:PaaI family thioesterase n=1 Tax=Sneathiella sp. TaxID=1964365 RepID=UPI0030021151